MKIAVGALAFKHKKTGKWVCFEYSDTIHKVSLVKDFDPVCCIVRDDKVLDNSYYDWFYHKPHKLNPEDFYPVELTITYTLNNKGDPSGDVDVEVFD